MERNEHHKQDVLDGHALVVDSEKGEKLTAEGVSCTFKITTDMTNNQLGIYEIVLQPHTTGANLHYHRFMDETFIVMSGILTIQTGNDKIEAERGSVVHAPRFTPHGFCNNSAEEVKIMLVFNPGQEREGFFYGLYDQFQKENPDEERLAWLNERFDNIPIVG